MGFTDNIKRFKDNEDVIDLKVIDEVDNNLDLLLSFGYTKIQISKKENIDVIDLKGAYDTSTLINCSTAKKSSLFKYQFKSIKLNVFSIKTNVY